MFDFFRSLFRPAPPSGETAKERLRLVLLSDHLSLAPDVVDSLKRDLIEVISRYVEIDVDHADVTFEHRDREIAMLASIPITAVRDRKTPEAPAPIPASTATVPASAEAVEVEPFFTDEPLVEPQAQPELELEPAPEPAFAATEARDVTNAEASANGETSPKPAQAKQPVRASNGAAPRRRRRKKYANGTAAAPNRAAQPQLAPSQAKAAP